MKVVLTSFWDAKNWQGKKYYISRTQPSGFVYNTFPVDLRPIINNRAMVHLEPDDFRDKYMKILADRTTELIDFFSLMYRDDEVVLLCWCNMVRQRQYEKLYCHRILVGYWLENVFGDELSVVYADGAENPVWERRSV